MIRHLRVTLFVGICRTICALRKIIHQGCLHTDRLLKIHPISAGSLRYFHPHPCFFIGRLGILIGPYSDFMRITLPLCVIACFALTNAYSQTLENVKTTFNGEKVIITYDLVSDNPEKKFKVTVFSGHDNYTAPLKDVTGAVGEGISGGHGLRIEWDAKKVLPATYQDISVRLRAVDVPRLKNLEQSVYKKGSTVNVNWTGGHKADKMNIELLRGDKVYKVIANSAENTSRYTWKVQGVKAGENYTIRLTDVTDPMQPTSTLPFEIKPKINKYVKIGAAVVVVAGGIIIYNQLNKDKEEDLPAITIKP